MGIDTSGFGIRQPSYSRTAGRVKAIESIPLLPLHFHGIRRLPQMGHASEQIAGSQITTDKLPIVPMSHSTQRTPDRADFPLEENKTGAPLRLHPAFSSAVRSVIRIRDTEGEEVRNFRAENQQPLAVAYS